METEQIIRDIKKELRAAMNGILSRQMREAGMPYKLVFGVELPRLMDIAREFPQDRQLAQQLWNENIRESKILALMLMPREEFSAELAEVWADEIPAAEIAQYMVMYLMQHAPWAAEVAFEWIATDSPMRQLCGFLCLARLLQHGAEMNERSMLELRDQAASLMPSADLHLQKAIRAVLSIIDT